MELNNGYFLFEYLMRELNDAALKHGSKFTLEGNHALDMVLTFAQNNRLKLIMQAPEDVEDNLWYVNLQTWRDYTKVLVFHWINAAEDSDLAWKERAELLKENGLTYNTFGIWLTKGTSKPRFSSFCTLAAIEQFELKWKAVK